MRLDTQLIPCAWGPVSERALEPALDGACMDGFKNDPSVTLWECNGCFCVLSHVRPGLPFTVWMVGGENFIECAHAINNLAHQIGAPYAYFRTRNPASLRMYGFLNPELVNPVMHEYKVWRFE